MALFRQQFQPADYNDGLFDEIRQRTQGPDEPMGIYLAVVENLFDRLTYEVPESTRLKIVLRNLDPFYQGQLGVRTINSFAELLKFGRMVEARKSTMEFFRPPKERHSRSLLEPDLAYVEVEPPKPSKGSRKPASVASTSSGSAGSAAKVICTRVHGFHGTRPWVVSVSAHAFWSHWCSCHLAADCGSNDRC